MSWLQSLSPIVQDTLSALGRVLLFLLPILILVPIIIWWERRLLSWMQDRIGPNRAGTITWSTTSKMVPPFLRGKKTRLFGLMQTICDGVKLFFKEDITPTAVDKIIYFVAPALALFPAFALGGTLPWGPWYGFYTKLTPISNASIGILYVLAISSLGVYGVVLSGYSSNNKYSLMGGLRSSAQLISYELAMGMSLACIVLATGSLRMTDMVRVQEGSFLGLGGAANAFQNWNAFTPYGFVAMVVFLICMVAETNRAPFDLPEAENELIAGYHTEYSSMKFAVFFMGEYASMFVFSGILAVVFLGGYNMLPINFHYVAEHTPVLSGLFDFLDRINYWLAPIWFMGKIVFMLSAMIWLRATLPRLRYDQLMSLGWKSLLPLATLNFVVVACWILISRLYGPAWGAGLWVVAAVILVSLWSAVKRATPRQSLEKREVRLVLNRPTPVAPAPAVD